MQELRGDVFNDINIVALDKYMLSGCELIDTENISLPSQNMSLLASEPIFKIFYLILYMLISRLFALKIK